MQRRSFLQGLMTALVGASVPVALAGESPNVVGVPLMTPEQDIELVHIARNMQTLCLGVIVSATLPERQKQFARQILAKLDVALATPEEKRGWAAHERLSGVRMVRMEDIGG